MRFRGFCFSLLTLTFSVVHPSAPELCAQVKNSPVSDTVVSKGTTNKSRPRTVGTSLPASKQEAVMNIEDVKGLSDDELSVTYDGLVISYSKDAILLNNVGAVFFERKNYDKAVDALKRAIILNSHPAFLTNLSIVYDTLGRNTEAVTAVQRAVFQSPKYARARSQLCELMLVSKRNADTLLCYEELKRITPLDTMAQTYYAIALMRSGGADKAITMLSPLSREPNPTPLLFNVLGNAYFHRKKYRQAADSFKQGVEIDPDNTELRYNLAICLTAGNNRIGALSQYDMMKVKDPALAEKLYRQIYRDKIIYVDEKEASRER